MPTSRENQGGKGIDAAGYQGGLPGLPLGHTTQVAWGFRDPGDGLLYEFIRVYRPARDLHGLGPICELDEDLSHWLTSHTIDDAETGQPRLLCRWIDYAGARRLAGRALTFRRFSSPLPGPDQTPRLLQLASLASVSRPVDPPPAGQLAKARS